MIRDAWDLVARATTTFEPVPATASDTVRRKETLRSREFATVRASHMTSLTTEFVELCGPESAAGTSHLLIFDGIAGTGKSVAARVAAVAFSRQRLQQEGLDVVDDDGTTHTRVPAAYINAASPATLKSAVHKPLCDYFRVDPGRQSTTQALLATLARRLSRHRTEVLFIDDAHHLQTDRRFVRVHEMKEMLEYLPCPVVLVGNDLEDDSVVASRIGESDPRQQLRHRIYCHGDYYGWWSPNEVEQLATAFERSVPLKRHKLGSLNYGELHKLAQGRPLQVMLYLRAAAVNAIGGNEQITMTAIKGIAKPGSPKAPAAPQGDAA